MGKKEAPQNECADMLGKIPLYLAGDLTLKEAKQFTGHLKVCDKCRDELEISYLLEEGIARAERGESIDLSRDLDEMLEGTEDAIQRLTQFHVLAYLSGAVAAFVLIACIIILYL